MARTRMVSRILTIVCCWVGRSEEVLGDGGEILEVYILYLIGFPIGV
jgi:hypothetical protein